jgi:hypothetical protein
MLKKKKKNPSDLSISFNSAKIVVHLSAANSNRPSGPVRQSRYSHIKLSFKQSGEREVIKQKYKFSKL